MVSKTSVKLNERGASKLTLIVFGSIIFVVLYCAFSILPFFYYYYELQNHMEAMIKVASIEPEREVRRRLVDHIKWMEIPADPGKLKIEKNGQFMKITLSYDEVFYVSWGGKEYDIHVFHFDAVAEGKM